MSRYPLTFCGALLMPALAAAWQSGQQPTELPASIAAPAPAAIEPAPTVSTLDARRLFGPAPRADRGPLAPISSDARDGESGWKLVPDNAPAPTPRQEQLDDSIPLPNPPLYETTPEGDVLVQPESGDPYFLGFAAGRHYPPEGERIDPLLAAQVQAAYLDGRPLQQTYAFAMLSKRITPERIAQLEALGARVLGFHPHYTLKLALPASSIDALAAHDAVHWVGLPRTWQKLHPALVEHLGGADANKPFEAWINLFESDLGPDARAVLGAAPQLANADGTTSLGEPQPLKDVYVTGGWMQRQLEALGVEVLDYNERIHAHRVRMMPQSVEAVAALDFVQFVERRVPEQPFHDESMGLINADDSRSFWTGGSNSRTVAGIVDSGVENSHNALNHIFGVGWDDSGAGDAWGDSCNHGTHVAGTMWSDGAGDNSLRGVARGLGWAATGRIFNVRIFNGCSGSVSVSSVLGHTSTSYNDGTNITPRPHVTNNSWGTSGSSSSPWIGSEADPRLYDDNAWADAQLNVFAAGNSGSAAGTVGEEASAKNVLTVGSVLDYNDVSEGLPGSIRSSSSRGPTGDNRWKPNVVAGGRWIRSADSTNVNGFFNNSGTSMAAPHVTGLASLIIDQRADFAYLPERMSAHLMATAVTKDNTVLSTPSAAHLDNYGAGRIDGTRAQWSSGGSHTSWAFSLSAGASTFGDFTVPSGATRLIAVMHYVETQSSAGASQALVNNWNMYLDQPPIDTAANNTGEWFAQQSSIDNTEIRILDNPIAGTWRWKSFPASSSSTAYFGVTVYVLTADVTPNVNLSVTADDIYVTPGQQVEITASASTSGATASAVFLNSTSSGDVLSMSRTTLLDGAVTNLLTNQHSGRDVLLGNLDPFFSRSATWRTSWATQGIKSWSVTAQGDNFTNPTQAVTVYVDGTPPSLPPGLVSTSHAINTWSNDNTIDFDWNPSTDAVSGVDGYGVSWGTAPGVFVANAKDTEETQTDYTTTALTSNATWYFAVKAVDNSGNWTAGTSEVGPYRIDTVLPTQPGVISSPSHTVNVQSCNTTVTVNWAASTDAHSGLSGYVGVWDTSATTNPVGANNIGAGATSFAQNIGSSGSGRYFHLRARDVAGNLSVTRHFGPIFATTSLVATYCTAKTNSLGCVPAITTLNLPSKSASNFTVRANNVLNQKNGLLFWGYGPLSTPFHGGTLCVAAPTLRTPAVSSGGTAPPVNNCTGTFAFVFTTAYLNANSIDPGDTIYCQWWSRDPAAPFTDSLTNAVRVTFCQ
jgi:hypothetical protein